MGREFQKEDNTRQSTPAAASGQRPGIQAGEQRAETVPPIVHEVLSSPGEPLDAETRAFFESRFGHDFSRVRVHADAKAAESAQAVNARAYTVGRHMVFSDGYPLRGGHDGSRLLAHELAHAVQQGESMAYDAGSLRVGPADSPAESEAFQVADAFSEAAEGTGHTAPQIRLAPVIARTPRPEEQELSREGGGSRRQSGRQTGRHSGQAAGRGRSLASIHIDSAPARIDNSMTVDQITQEFYRIPVELIPPNAPIPGGPVLTIGRYGCDIRRYGLTGDDFSLTLEFDDANVVSRSHPFMGGSGLQTVQCWADRFVYTARIRNTIWLPNDVATHPCLQGEDPVRFQAETLAHERLHESDNNAAVEETMRRLSARLGFTPGIGSTMAMARITADPEGFVQECRAGIRRSLERLRGEHEIVYRQISAERAIMRDPHDRELHELKLRLMRDARARSSASE